MKLDNSFWNTLIFVIFLYTIGMILFLSFALTSGCASIPQNNDTKPVVTSNQVIIQAIKSTDWILSLMLIGSVVGLFAGFNGLKTGFAGTAACVGGIFLKAALTSTYVYWFSGFIFIGCVLAAIASILYKNRAVKDLIVGTQFLKQAVPDKDRVANIFDLSQTNPTKQLVNQIKSSLKSKGIIQ
jgi:hypothetical protein